jgi:hypothetical protein
LGIDYLILTIDYSLSTLILSKILYYFFAALVTKRGTGQVLGLAVRASPGDRLFIRRMPALWAKPGVRRQVLSAVSTLMKNELLVPAMGTKL